MRPQKGSVGRGIVTGFLLVAAATGVVRSCAAWCSGARTSSPIWMGSRLRVGSLKVAIIESERTRNLPSLTDDTEYMTTKNANSRVMKSA